MKKRMAGVLPLFLVLILAFAAAGCLVPVENIEPAVKEARVEVELTPEELLNRVVEAYRGVTTFQHDMEMTMNMTTVVNGKTIDMQTSTRQHGALDIANQRMRMAMTMETAMPPMPGVAEQVMVVEMATYWVDGMTYMKIAMPDMPPVPGMPPAWTKFEMPWICPIEQTIALLEVSEIAILRVEEVNGVESYLIEVTPDITKLWEMMQWMIPRLEPPAVMEIDLEEMFKEVSIKQWIDRETFLPLKEQWKMTIVLAGAETELSMEDLYHSFNEPVTIELPPEAAEAEDMTIKPLWCPPGG